MGLGIILFIGKPITLSKYYSKHEVSSMSVVLKKEDGTYQEKELSEAEMEGFMKRFGSYKVFKPLLRSSFIALNEKSSLAIRLRSDNKKFDLVGLLTEQGEINLIRYTFYPYRSQHKDINIYLMGLLGI
jgi:hypothetical protein